MATGNPFLGTLKGSVGDITMYKAGGKQVLRARIRDIKNPNTQGQLIQRAIQKSVSLMYSVGKEIFNHSFEGKAVKAGSYQQFLSVNMRQLRNDIISDVRNSREPEAAVGAVVARGTYNPTLYSFIVSQGTLDQRLFSLAPNNGDMKAVLGSAEDASLTLKAFFEKYGVVSGDIYTIVTLGCTSSDGAFTSQYGQDGSQPDGRFSALRLEVRDDALADDSTLYSEASFAKCFLISGKDVDIKAATLISEGVAYGWSAFNILESPFMGIIRSRRNSGLRSTCRLQTVGSDGSSLSYTPAYGIKFDYLLNAWVEEQDQLGASQLILEGGSFQQGAV